MEDKVFLGKAHSPEIAEAQRWLRGEDVPEPDLWALAHTVNAYDRFEPFTKETHQWIEQQLPRLMEDGAKKLKTQELLDLLFLWCRYERFCEEMLESVSHEIEVIMHVLHERRIRSLDKENGTQEELLRAPFFIPYGADNFNVGIEVAKAAEESHPQESIEIYQAYVETRIEWRGRENYRIACQYLTHVRRLYQKIGRSDEWTTSIAALLEQNRNLRALKDELAKAKL